MNAGFLEALKLDPELDCFVFADVDLIPIHLCNIYECSKQPRHLAVYVDKFKYKSVDRYNDVLLILCSYVNALGGSIRSWLEAVWL